MLAVQVKLCDSRKTRTGRPCKNRVPCSRHSLKAVSQQKLGKLNSEQRDKLVRGVLAGKDVRRAALDAGYSETTVEGRIYQIIRTPDMRDRFRRIANAAALDVNEIIGTLVQQMRFDLIAIFTQPRSMGLRKQQVTKASIQHSDS